VGEVVAVGPDVKNVTIGARHLVHPWIGCGSCAVCRQGTENLCKTPRNLGVFSDGGYSDHLLVPHPRYLFDLGDLSPQRAAPLACSGITAYSALKKVGPLIEDEPIVIIGAGGLGLMALALHRAMGGKAAIVVDVDPIKRDAAKDAGAQAVIDGSAADAARQITDATNGGAWAVVDFVGASDTAKLGVESLTKGGKLIIVGLFGGEITMPIPFFPMRAIAIQGSYVGSLPEMKELLELVRRSGPLSVPLRTRPLEEVNAVLNDLNAGKVIGRVVLTPAG
jgi:alcohol dehydrogenase, propanol-preferring